MLKTLIVNTKWYAIYTRPRWEKKVNFLLQGKGIESYCPLNKVRRKWSDRIKTIEEPLFKSYVFVKIDEEARTNVRMTDGVINFVYWNGKPAMVKEKEIQVIKQFLGEYENVSAIKIDLKPDQRVRIVAGPLMVVRVAVDSLGYILVADINKGKLMFSNNTNF
jgi:transcription antitermination factor NusG